MSRKILAVDDDPVIRQIIEVMLQAEGYSPVLAENGEVALNMLKDRDFAREICLILLDKQMPGMNGFEVLNEVRTHNHLSKLPVIMLTAEDKPDDIMDGYGAGADYYITKPFTREQLVYGLKLVLGR